MVINTSLLHISSEWTPEERRRVIDAILYDVAALNDMLLFLRDASPGFLEANRRNFKGYVEMPAASVKD